MKVLFLPDYSKGNPYQRELAEGLRRRAVSVHLTDGNGPFPLLEAVRSLGKPEVLHLHWTEPFMASRLAPGTSLVKSIRFILELLSLKVGRIRLVWTVHNLAHHEQLNPRIELLSNRICARLYDQMIVHCRFAKDAVLQTYSLPRNCGEKIAIIPHGNYIGAYQNSIDTTRARAYFGFEDQDTVFLFFGSIRPYKGILRLVSAFQALDHPRSRLLIAGQPRDEAMQKELEDHLLGDERIDTRLAFIPDDEIQIYMNAADVVVLPFEDVLSSGSVLLAASFGKPVVTPRLGCVTEALENWGAFLYDPSREEGLVHAMRQALSADLTALGRSSFERAAQFDWDDIARKTHDVYQRCLA